MAIDKGITEVPNSDDEPMTSSPAAISDQTDKLHPARPDAPQASQDLSQDVACEAQALVKETTASASKQLESLAVGPGNHGEDTRTSKFNSSANTQPNDNDRCPDTAANAATTYTRGSLGMKSSKTEPDEMKASGHQISASSQLALQPDSRPDQEKNTLDIFVEPASMQKAPILDRPSLVPTIEKADAAKPSLTISESVATDEHVGTSFPKHREQIHEPSNTKVLGSELPNSDQPKGPNSEAAATSAGCHISSPTTNEDTMKKPPNVVHHEIQSEQILSEVTHNTPTSTVASDMVNKNTDSNTPTSMSFRGAPLEARHIEHSDHMEEDITTLSKFKPALKSHMPAKSSQEAALAELKAQRTALLASLAALPNIRELISQDGEPAASPEAFENEPTDADIMAAANKIVKGHIKLLHEYNEIKDVGQGLMGLIADQRGVRIVEVQDEFGIGQKG